MAKPGKKKRTKRSDTSLRVKPKKAGAAHPPASGDPSPTVANAIPPSTGQGPTPDGTALARITELEADRTNLMAQVAWARGVAQEQQKALEAERERTRKLEADLEAQRARIEQLKALSALDRLLGRHKRV